MAIYSPGISLAEQPTIHAAEVKEVASEEFGEKLHVEPLTGGSNPDVFNVRGSLGRGVLKFFPEASKQADYEVASMERSRDAGLPVPAVLGHGALETQTGYRPWFAMEHASGRPMTEAGLSMSEETVILRSLGRLLAKLHSPEQPTPDGFWRQTGVKEGRPTWQFSTWYDYLGHIGETLEDNADYLLKAGLTPNEVEKILANVAEYRLEPPHRAVFSHADLRKNHVYVDDTHQITSIIDWGSGQANTPEREFSKPFTTDDEPMVEAYATAAGWSKEELTARIRRMQTAHLPGLVIFNVKKGRMEDAHDRAQEVKQLLGRDKPTLN